MVSLSGLVNSKGKSGLMPHRVLIVSPHFPPVNAPDHQRVRMSLPYLAEFGWEAHVLAVAPEQVEAGRDDDLLCTIPDTTPVTRVGAIPLRLTRRFGFGSLGLRAFRALDRAGARLLRQGAFDLVYFSTTIFAAMSLGLRWKRRLGIPYVLDMQDPWLSDYYAQNGVRPPGGRLRYGFARWLARRSEPRAIRGAGHIICVSPAYPEMLRSRYPDVGADRFSVLPFGASQRDMEVVKERGVRQTIFDPTDGCLHWIYLGRGGADMAKALRGLFLALRSLRGEHPQLERLRLHFVGTSYAGSGRAERTVQPLAQELGVGDLVTEQPERIPYLQGLALIQASDAVLVIGSDDPGYSASKVYPCILSRRPLLAILHEASLAGSVVTECRAGSVVPFASGQSPESLVERIRPELRQLLDRTPGAPVGTDWSAFARYSAREMTRRQCAVFDQVRGQWPQPERLALSTAGGAV
jgi:hypothetical protein